MDLSREDLQEIIRDAVSQAVSAQQCPCGLSEDAAREVPHFYSMIKDAGGGDYAKGVEAMRASTRFVADLQAMVNADDWREDMRFVRKWRRACEKTGNIVLCFLVMGALGLIGLIGGMGWWTWIEKGGK